MSLLDTKLARSNSARSNSARNNPFNAAAQDSIKWIEPPQGLGLKPLLADLSELNFRAAIVGPKGSGKTTLLAALQPHIANRGLTCYPITFSRDARTRKTQFTNIVAARNLRKRKTVLLVDGSERLSWRQRCSLTRSVTGNSFRENQTGIVVAIHRQTWLLPTLVRARPDLETLEQILRQLRMADRDVIEESKTLFEFHNGNIRLVLRSLYDQYAAGRFSATPSHV